ncbi:MAG: secondary thiamine-phosphate synthase enzyme YjbQ [Nitrospirota bacterium]
MPVKTVPLRLDLRGGTQVENITKLVQQAVERAGLRAGIATVFIKHTTASVLIIEDEPGIRADTKSLWDRLIPADPAWQHNIRNPGEDNGHSHLRAQLQGSSVTIPFTDGSLLLGTWQQVVVVDFDTRARTRELVVQVIGE